MDATMGEIRMFSFGVVPSGWAECDGRMLSVVENLPLFGLLGTTFGGDGVKSFGLPDLRGRAGTGAAMPGGAAVPTSAIAHAPGTAGGVEAMTLSSSNFPAHGHTLFASGELSDGRDPAGALWGNVQPSTVHLYRQPNGDPRTILPSETLSAMGSNVPHRNMQPYVALNFCIALTGSFPVRPSGDGDAA